MEVGKCAPQYAIHHLEKAFKLFFNRTCKYPRFKKKGKKDSFVAIENNVQFKQNDLKIHIPRLGKIKCSENLRFIGKVNHVIITRKANMWFAVINVEVPESALALKQNMGENQAIVGVDLGIKSMMVLSDGTVFENSRALKSNLKRLKQRQRRLSKKQKGSKNKRKQQMNVARLHYRISCIRSNAIHQATAFIVNRYHKIVMETLNASGMAKNGRLAQAVGDVSFGEIARQLTYKCAWQGKELVKADRWFASSKICSSCGHKKEQLKLSERTYNCEKCGLSIDRDLNAAKNLASYSPTEKFSESHAFGVGSSSVEIPDSLTVNKELKINLLNN